MIQRMIGPVLFYGGCYVGVCGVHSSPSVADSVGVYGRRTGRSTCDG